MLGGPEPADPRSGVRGQLVRRRRRGRAANGGSLLAGHRAATATAVICALLISAVVAFAVRATGNPARHVELNDGRVWVTDRQDGVFGAINNPIRQLNGYFYPSGGLQNVADIDVLQSNGLAIAWDRSKGIAYPIDSAFTRAEPDSAAVTGTDQFALGGHTVAALDPHTGTLWAAELAAPDPTPSLSGLQLTKKRALAMLGADAALAVSQDGDVFAASGSTGQAVTIRASDGKLGRVQKSRVGFTTSALAMTAVGDTAVVLDITNSTVSRLGGTPRPVGDNVFDPTGSNGSRVALQQPGPKAADVVLATSQGLRSIPLDGGVPRLLVSGVSGAPAAPVVLDGCIHGAWAGTPGTYARICGGGKPATQALPIAVENRRAVQLVFRVNRDQIVLNDLVTGAVVTLDPLQQAGDWDQLLPKVTKNNPKSKKNPNPNANTAKSPPKARDDQLGARAGRTDVLHILDNDSSTSGGVLSVASISPAGAVNGATLSIAPDGQTVEIAVPAGGTGPYIFSYTDTDGHGKTSNQAQVTVRLSPANGPDGAPALRAKAKALSQDVAAGSSAAYQVLSDWRDPESDPLLLLSASVEGGTASTTSDGRILVTAPSRAGRAKVTFTVSDGYGQTKDGVINLRVRGADSTDALPPTAEWDVVRGDTGGTLHIDPLANDVPGSDPTNPNATLTLAGDVTADNNGGSLALDTNQKTGEVAFTAQQAGTYFLTYHESFGASNVVTGHIRVDIKDSSNATIITVPDLGIIRGEQPAIVDTLANDFDPGGGVMVVQQALESGRYADLDIAIIDHRWLRVTPRSASIGLPRTIRYQVTDGTSGAVWGQASIVQVPAASKDSPPIAQNDAATVRAGDSTVSAVLDNDSDPDGDALHLVPGGLKVVSTLADPGVASISGNSVRYAAPASIITQKDVTISYVVADPSGAATTGTLTVTVQPVDRHDTAPTPRDLQASVVAGDEVTIPVPTTGVDPEGDSVTVSGLDSAPKLGRVEIGPDSIRYESYPNYGDQGLGTDEFSYLVVDRFGKVGEATVRVAVVPPGTPQPPVAVDDTILVAPNTAVTVSVLANDYVTAGADVTLSLPKNNRGLPRGTAFDKANDLRTTSPRADGDSVVITYQIDDGSGHTSQGRVKVTSRAGFDNPPVAHDDQARLPKSGDSVGVAVLDNDTDPDGPDSALKVVKVFGAASIDDNGHSVTVQLNDYPHTVDYLVQDGAAEPQTAIGFIHVPGKGTGAPMLRPDVSPIQLKKNGHKSVNINDYVVDPAGKPLRLTTKDRIWASPENGLSVASNGTAELDLTGLHDYVGPAALTFEVSDGKSLSDGLRAMVMVPVQIGDPAPVIRCPTSAVDVVQGGRPLALDVVDFCHVWTPADLGASGTSFTVSWQKRLSGVDLGQSGSANRMLQITAHGSAKPNVTGTLTISAPGAKPATLNVRVIAAPAPLLAPIDREGLRAGKPTTIDVTPYLTSQIADPSIAVLKATRTGGPAAAVTLRGSSLTVTPDAGSHGSATFIIQVTDVANQPARSVTGLLTVGIIGPPDTPGTPTATSSVSRTVQLSFTSPAANGTPVTGYTARDQDHNSYPCAASGCQITGLTNGRTYRFVVIAHSRVGNSKPSGASNPVTPDVVPDAPPTVAATPKDQSVAVTWGTAPSSGSAVSAYQVQISPAPDSGQGTQPVGSAARSYTFHAVRNGVNYTVRVRAKNRKGFGDWSESVPVTPFGKPQSPAPPTVAAADSTDRNEKALTVRWNAPNGNGRPIQNYTLRTYRNGAVASTATVGATSYTTSVPNNGNRYYFTVAATNQGNLTSAYSGASNTTEASSRPDQMAKPGARASGKLDGNGDGGVTVTFTLPNAHGAALQTVYYVVNGGAARAFPSLATTQTIYLPTGQNDRIQVFAKNKNGNGAASPQSDVVNPYGPPSKPTATATNSGSPTNPQLSFGWSGGSGNGRAITYQIQIDSGAWADKGSQPGSETKAFGNSETHTVHVRIKTSAGTTTADSASAKTDARPAGSVVPDKGSNTGVIPGSSADGCPNGDCFYIGFHATNVPTGDYVFRFRSSSGSYDKSVTVHVSGASFTYHSPTRYYGYNPPNIIYVTLIGAGGSFSSGAYRWYPNFGPA